MKTKKLFVLAGLVWWAGMVGAADVVLPDLRDTYVPAKPQGDGLYRALGGEAGIAALVDDFQKRLLADARIAPFFADADPQRFRTHLSEELCMVSGGPCTRKRDVRRVHSAMDIQKAHFNAVVELLQQSLDARGIAFSDQNRLLAVLAPMHRDIITVGNAP